MGWFKKGKPELNMDDHSKYLDNMKSLIDKLTDIEKKYIHLSPSLQSPRIVGTNEIDYANMPVAYRRHLSNIRETLLPIVTLTRLPAALNNINKQLTRTDKLLDKEDFDFLKKRD